MSGEPKDPTIQHLDEVAIGRDAPISPSIPGLTPSFPIEGTVFDWRTIDPATIRGEDVPVEELRYYREKIDELLQDGKGKYVLIVGRSIVSYFETLEEAVRHAEKSFDGRMRLIKKVAEFGTIQTFGGVVG